MRHPHPMKKARACVQTGHVARSDFCHVFRVPRPAARSSQRFFTRAVRLPRGVTKLKQAFDNKTNQHSFERFRRMSSASPNRNHPFSVTSYWHWAFVLINRRQPRETHVSLESEEINTGFSAPLTFKSEKSRWRRGAWYLPLLSAAMNPRMLSWRSMLVW